MANTPQSQVLHLAQLVAYQDDTVVSRQITKSSAGNVTLFAFDAGQELSEHTAPFDALAHVLDGEAQIEVNRQPHLLRTGDAIVMPANVVHAVKATQRFKMLLTMIHD
jgi:quercetin dioxygenase-like cupin family protein